ncbi:MAG TPA: adenosylhomocysteinase, partial [bacterium]|nr:adenosylhomocysteinase [bacterium]
VRNMPLTRAQADALPPLDGVRLACSIHLEPKVAPALEAMIGRGAAIFLTTCNISTVREELVERLLACGARAHAWKGMTQEDAAEADRRAVSWGPTHLWETGARLSSVVAAAGHAASRAPRAAPAPAIAAAMECTGSGIAVLARLEGEGRFPPYPVFDCDSVPLKEGLHNRYLVGQTTWHTFTERTHLSLHRKRVLVVGYGLVGQGVAVIARGLGGTVSVAERDPARAVSARYEGFPTGRLEDMVSQADVIVTATGARGVLSADVLARCADGCIILNVGHNPDEIDVEALGPLRAVIPFVEEARVGDRTVFLFAGGSMANLTAGQGDTLNSFDITMATMLAGLRFVFSAEARACPPRLHPLPRAAWEEVARQAAG